MSDRLLFGTRKGFFSARPSGGAGSWSIEHAALLGSPVSMVLADPRDGRLYAAVKLGHFGCKLHRSADGGATWQECTVPKYPPKPEGVEPVRCPMRGIEVPWDLQMVWSLEPGGADEPGVLWCGTIPGGLFRSTDGAESWELVRSLWDQPTRSKWFGGGYDFPGVHSICVDPRNSRRVTVAISCGGVWRTDDGGASWRIAAQGMRANYTPPEQQFDVDIQDPHRMAQCPSRPDVLWVQHHNGIFRTTDGGTAWQEVSNAQPSSFGFTVAAHPHDGDTAWFVPATSDETRIPKDGRLVVTRTADGGLSFETLSRGLPQQHDYDLIYRHCLDVDAAGQCLALGSTTGNAFTSGDAGETWQRLDAQLPPINCVRFG